MKHFSRWSAKEHRFLHLFKEFGSNVKTWAGDAGETYIGKPVRNGNPIKTLAGAGMLVASTVLEATDYAAAGVFDQRLKAPTSVPFSRTRRDVGNLLTDVVHLRPIKSILDVVRLATTDVPMDGVETMLGFEHTGARNIRNTMRSKAASTFSQAS